MDNATTPDDLTTSHAYQQELAARAFTDAPSTETASGTLESALRRYVERVGTSGKAGDPYTNEELGIA